MPTQVVMPQMGESLSEGTVIKWHKKPGDHVERDEPLLEISTDKVDTEVPAPATGVIERILVAEGETVDVGTVMAVIADSTSAQPRATAAPATPATAPTSQEKPESGGGGGHFRQTHEPLTFQRKAVSGGSTTTTSDAHFSPAVRAAAAELRITDGELAQIEGSGRSGRVTKKDVVRYAVRRQGERERAKAPLAEVERGPIPQQYLYQPEPEDKLVPMSPMRRQIAEHMVLSQQISAQVTSFTECDMHRIVRYRDEQRERFQQNEGVPLTYLPFVAEATVRALREFPIFNASVVGEQIALKKHVHLGVAVALEEGLIVPVVRNADEKNFIGLARSIHELAEKARSRGLQPDDVRGATFTITNPGMFGGMMGTPMIAQPQVAILGLGAVQKKPVVIDDAIGIRPIMVLALTFDHRIIDGATGFQFLERIRVLLEDFELPEL